MDFDFKITTWERATVPKEKEQEVLQAIKEGKIFESSDIWGICEDLVILPLDNITSEPISVRDNDGCATIEVLDDDGETIYENV